MFEIVLLGWWDIGGEEEEDCWGGDCWEGGFEGWGWFGDFYVVGSYIFDGCVFVVYFNGYGYVFVVLVAVCDSRLYFLII